MNTKLNVVISKDEEGYFASCPVLKGCHTQGETFEETMINIKEAIDLYLETMSQKEINETLSQEIFTTTIDIKVA
jgi:predicted RNase H-like HicB family nuclease